MKIQIAMLIGVCVATLVRAQTDELSLFDRYHAEYDGWLASEVQILKEKDAEAAAFQAQVNKMHHLWGQMERIAFTNIIARDPGALDWTAPTLWATGFLSSNLFSELKATNPAFRTLAEQHGILERDLRQQESAADRLRDVRQRSQTELKPLERAFYFKMMEIQKTLQETRKKRAQPTPAGDSQPARRGSRTPEE